MCLLLQCWVTLFVHMKGGLVFFISYIFLALFCLACLLCQCWVTLFLHMKGGLVFSFHILLALPVNSLNSLADKVMVDETPKIRHMPVWAVRITDIRWIWECDWFNVFNALFCMYQPKYLICQNYNFNTPPKQINGTLWVQKLSKSAHTHTQINSFSKLTLLNYLYNVLYSRMTKKNINETGLFACCWDDKLFQLIVLCLKFFGWFDFCVTVVNVWLIW